MFARSFEKAPMLRITISLLALVLLASCGGKVEDTISGSSDKEIKDLPFAKAASAKEYSDLILRGLRTNRDKPLYNELANPKGVDAENFNTMIGMYSTGIIGRDDWDFRDVYEENEGKNETAGFDYAWLDPRGRLGIQIYIQPILKDGRYKLEKIELRSRLEVMESVAYPAAEIEDYKKLAFNWEQK